MALKIDDKAAVPCSFLTYTLKIPSHVLIRRQRLAFPVGMGIMNEHRETETGSVLDQASYTIHNTQLLIYFNS